MRNLAEPAPLPSQLAPITLPEPPMPEPPALPAPMPISGLGALAETSRKSLCALGRVLACIPADAESLPRAYQLRQLCLDAVASDDDADDETAYIAVLPHIERMAAAGLTPGQIAARLGIELLTVQEAAVFITDFGLALRGGRARGIDIAAATIGRNIAAGATDASRFFLQAQGGDAWQTKKPLVQIVNANPGNGTAAVDITAIEEMKARQMALLEDVDYSLLD